MSDLQIHIQTPPQPPYSKLRDCWRALEDAGYDAIWTWDHFFTETTPGDFEGWSLLAALAEATERARIGVFVTAITFRHPSLLAKIITTVDHISDGRLIVGLGAARLPSEHEAFGIEFPGGGQRLRMLRESIEVIDGLASDEPVSFVGRYAKLRGARGIPGPVQKPRPPILIGGHGERMLKLTAQKAQWWNAFGSPERFGAMCRKLDALCEDLGRDPKTLRRLAPIRADAVAPGVARSYLEAGADSIIVIATDNEVRELVKLREVIAADAS